MQLDSYSFISYLDLLYFKIEPIAFNGPKLHGFNHFDV